MNTNGLKKSSRGSLISDKNDQKNSRKSILDNSKLNDESEAKEIQSLQIIPQNKKTAILPRNHSSTIQAAKLEFSKENKKSHSIFFDAKKNSLQLENDNKPNNKKKLISNIVCNVETPTFDTKLNCEEVDHLNPSLKNIPEESVFQIFQEKKHSSMILDRNEFLDESEKFDSDYSGDSLSEPEEEFIFSETVLGKKEVHS